MCVADVQIQSGRETENYLLLLLCLKKLKTLWLPSIAICYFEVAYGEKPVSSLLQISVDDQLLFFFWSAERPTRSSIALYALVFFWCWPVLSIMAYFMISVSFDRCSCVCLQWDDADVCVLNVLSLWLCSTGVPSAWWGDASTGTQASSLLSKLWMWPSSHPALVSAQKVGPWLFFQLLMNPSLLSLSVTGECVSPTCWYRNKRNRW